MAKGAIAKEQVEQKIIQAFGSDYVTTLDKKIYVWGEENGEKVQVAISLTCPKAPVAADSFDFSDGVPSIGTSVPEKVNVEITQEETEKLEDLLKRIGL